MNRCIFIVIPMACYLIQGGLCWTDSDRPHAVMYVAYALANVGLIWHELSK